MRYFRMPPVPPDERSQEAKTLEAFAFRILSITGIAGWPSAVSTCDEAACAELYAKLMALVPPGERF